MIGEDEAHKYQRFQQCGQAAWRKDFAHQLMTLIREMELYRLMTILQRFEEFLFAKNPSLPDSFLLQIRTISIAMKYKFLYKYHRPLLKQLLSDLQQLTSSSSTVSQPIFQHILYIIFKTMLHQTLQLRSQGEQYCNFLACLIQHDQYFSQSFRFRMLHFQVRLLSIGYLRDQGMLEMARRVIIEVMQEIGGWVIDKLEKRNRKRGWRKIRKMVRLMVTGMQMYSELLVQQGRSLQLLSCSQTILSFSALFFKEKEHLKYQEVQQLVSNMVVQSNIEGDCFSILFKLLHPSPDYIIHAGTKSTGHFNCFNPVYNHIKMSLRDTLYSQQKVEQQVVESNENVQERKHRKRLKSMAIKTRKKVTVQALKIPTSEGLKLDKFKLHLQNASMLTKLAHSVQFPKPPVYKQWQELFRIQQMLQREKKPEIQQPKKRLKDIILKNQNIFPLTKFKREDSIKPVYRVGRLETERINEIYIKLNEDQKKQLQSYGLPQRHLPSVNLRDSVHELADSIKRTPRSFSDILTLQKIKNVS